MSKIIFFYPSFEKGGATKILIKIINFFNKKNINESIKKEKRPLATRIIGNEQVSGCLLQPHHFIIIEKII